MFPARQAVPPCCRSEPKALPSVSDAVSDVHALRRPIDPRDNVLHHRTIKWLVTLPVSIRPIATGRLYHAHRQPDWRSVVAVQIHAAPLSRAFSSTGTQGPQGFPHPR